MTRTCTTTVQLHNLTLLFQTANPNLSQRFGVVYGHLPKPRRRGAKISIQWRLHNKTLAPPPPKNLAALSKSPLISYFGNAQQVVIRMPKYALLSVDLQNSCIDGVVTQNCLDVYGAFEDVMMISLAPLYRRMGWYPLHAFAALSPGPGGQVALISGEMGAGKTTTGLALLSAGWKLLSNDSPLLRLRRDGVVEVLACPGQLSAFDDSLARFPALQKFIPQNEDAGMPVKRVFRAEEAFSNPWAEKDVAGGLFFPKVVAGLSDSELVKIPPTETMLSLMPQAVEGWDKAAIGKHLQLLGKLAEQAPSYKLLLSPNVNQLPGLLKNGME